MFHVSHPTPKCILWIVPMKKEIGDFLWILGMFISFPFFWSMSKKFRENFNLYHKDRAKWQDKIAERFAEDFLERYQEIMDRFD